MKRQHFNKFFKKCTKAYTKGMSSTEYRKFKRAFRTARKQNRRLFEVETHRIASMQLINGSFTTYKCNITPQQLLENYADILPPFFVVPRTITPSTESSRAIEAYRSNMFDDWVQSNTWWINGRLYSYKNQEWLT